MAGDDHERALARVFDLAGEYVQRGGSSGSGNRRVKASDEPLTRLADPRSKKDDPSGHAPNMLAHPGLMFLMTADDAQSKLAGVTPGDD